MKLKLSYIEFMALLYLCEHITGFSNAHDPYDRLLHMHLARIYQKLYRLAILKKPRYQVKLTEEEAIAFWLLFDGVSLPFNIFEANLLTKISNSIHQQFIAA